MKESKRVSTLSYSGQHGDNGIVLKCRHVVLVTGSSRGEVELKGGEVKEETSAANRLIGEVVQSRRRPLLGPSPG